MTKVLIVDDQVLLRESLKFLIEQDQEIEVVGCAANGFEALESCAQTMPDVVLMDIMMPVCDGVEGTRLIKKDYPGVKVMILTTFGDDQNLAAALKNGAEGYLLKDLRPEALVLAIKSLAKGIPVMHQVALSTMLKQLGADQTVLPRAALALNEREVAVLRLIVDGKSNKEIAAATHLSAGRVKNIVTAVLDKVKLKDRTQLAVYAVKNHLI